MMKADRQTFVESLNVLRTGIGTLNRIEDENEDEDEDEEENEKRFVESLDFLRTGIGAMNLAAAGLRHSRGPRIVESDWLRVVMP